MTFCIRYKVQRDMKLQNGRCWKFSICPVIANWVGSTMWTLHFHHRPHSGFWSLKVLQLYVSQIGRRLLSARNRFGGDFLCTMSIELRRKPAKRQEKAKTSHIGDGSSFRREIERCLNDGGNHFDVIVKAWLPLARFAGFVSESVCLPISIYPKPLVLLFTFPLLVAPRRRLALRSSVGVHRVRVPYL